MSSEASKETGNTPKKNHEQVVPPEQLRRAVLASSVGSALEYYDFYIYGLASALIFGPLFFSGLGGSGAGLIASFSTYAVGFAARPIGGIIFGALGDKLGRKTILVLTISLMGAATFLIGALPTYATAGALAPILLVVLRVIQGLGAGAEQAGATVLISEFAPPRRRGFFSALPFVGIQLGTLLGAGVFAILGGLGDDVTTSWYWRIPFLISGFIVVFALVIRLKMQESPAFQTMEKNSQVKKNPVGEMWRTSKRNVLRGIGLRMAENGNSSIYQTLALSFIAGLNIYEDPETIGPIGASIAAACAAIMVVVFGRLSDRFGRVNVYRYGALFQAIIALPAFYLMTLGEVWLFYVVLAVGIAIGVQSMLGPQCALLPELFGVSHRYTGVALSREFSAVIAGGIAPLVGASLLVATNYSFLSIGLYSLVLSLITFGTTFVTPEPAGRDMTTPEDADKDPVILTRSENGANR